MPSGRRAAKAQIGAVRAWWSGPEPVLVENSATGLDLGLLCRPHQRSCMSHSPIESLPVTPAMIMDALDCPAQS
jgi:hypothetical protein